MRAKPDILSAMLEVAKIQSTGASNRIEGIFTSEARLEELVSKKAEPMNRDEEEIAGYREVLNTIHENYDYIILRSSVILQLHRDLYSFHPFANGGRYKINIMSLKKWMREEAVEFGLIPYPLLKRQKQ